jgi:hypothetical protein
MIHTYILKQNDKHPDTYRPTYKAIYMQGYIRQYLTLPKLINKTSQTVEIIKSMQPPIHNL